ncbi:DUF1127 domain-containing protein [Tabrizicola sp. J26]|uniref:DUF1127 domain-containing protein n=1 Tax=Alitabrizicola rongguiensis TaxID=2909234 RepID=UPI001F2ADA45|nr:DUF1127 domain-containing protein [Tabrizicola rongguiensis]MCF1710224.1 DUF1127 domain-containing protein [Tabrizicola rongguiensis]
MTISIAHSAPRSTVGFFTNLKQAFARKMLEMHVYAQTRDELEAMTDRELADIGIARFMIGDIASEAARRA